MTNRDIAERLLEHARSLTGSANLFRARAYRNAAMAIQRCDVPLAKLNQAQIAAIHGIGHHLAFTIANLIRTGELVSWRDRAAA